MKKIFLFAILLLAAALESKAQNLMEIYQNTGNILPIPMEAIDSVRFVSDPPPQVMRVFLNDQRIFSLKISSIDSIAYSLPPAQLLPEVLTLSITAVGNNNLMAQGSVQNEGPSAVNRRGFCWSLQPFPSITNNHSEQGSGFGSFTDTIGPLEPGKQYFVRAYASNAAGTAYGEEFSISTASASSGNAPSVSTNAIQYTYESTALSGGNVTAAGSFPVTARGLCWASGTTPTLNHSFCVNGSGQGSFSSTIDQLMPEAVYKVRAWALSEAGVSYGEEKQFTFGRLAQLQTISASSVRSFSAIGGGKIINSMGPLRKKGICWGTNLYPVISKNQHSKDSTSSTDGFAAMMTGLQPGNTYYYRSYAQSTIGLSYGPVMKVTAAELTGPTLTDIDGNVYQTDTIGSQIWMLENLRVTRLNNGTQLLHLPAVQSWYNNFEPGWCYYNNDSSNNLVYGKLYNYETMSVQTSTLSVCPTGWSMPLETDWTKLREFAGTKSALKLRATGGTSAGTGLWDDGLYNPGTDDFGFSALPGGYRQHSPQEFANESREANFWAYWDRRFKIIDYGMEVTSSSAQDYDGLSIRCIKKVSAGTIGALLCDSASFSGPLMHKRPAKNFSVALPYTGGKWRLFLRQRRIQSHFIHRCYGSEGGDKGWLLCCRQGIAPGYHYR